MATTCPACGVPVPDGARFCPECGQRIVVAPDERRQVTVLMADLVGFTALSAESDPEQVKRLVDDCFERLVADVTAFGGRLDKIVGDELVAQFGAPIAHEDDPERAVRAALQMQQTLAALGPELGVAVQIRIGINTGEAVVGAMRAGGDPTVMGDVVNTAQRLEKLGAPGEITVGPATYAATRDVMSYEALGPQGLPGREEPVDAYRAVSALSPPGRRREYQRSPFLGRDVELTMLRNVIELAAARHSAHLVVIAGDAGVGKSRLARELAAVAASDHGAGVFAGQCVPYGDANVYGPVAELLRDICGLDGDHDASVRERVTSHVAAALGLSIDSAETERVAEGLVFLVDGVTRPGVDPGRARDEALRAVITFLEALADRGPLVLTLSDLHWASDEVLDVCNRVLARLHSRPFVLIATARPGLDARWTPEPGRFNAMVLHLEPLDDNATGELVRALFCGEADDETVAFLLERSGGNPFFVEELVRFVEETRDGERVRELPATLHGLVAARLDVLDPAERSLLEDCAVVGASGTIADALALAGRPDGRHLLDRLTERDLLQVDRDEFQFKSELIREIAYGTLTKAERARRHAGLAPVLATRGEGAIDQSAHHLATAAELVAEIGTVTGVPVDIRERAIDALMRAADRDEAVESWLHADRHYDRTLGLLDTANTEPRRHALLGRARARVQMRMLDDGRDDAMTALGDARDVNDRHSEALALTLLGEGEAAAGAYDIADGTLADALVVWRELGDDSGAANVLRDLGVSHLFRGDLVQAERFVSEALASFRATGNQRGAAWALQNLAWISFNHGNIVQAEKRLEESADLFGELGDWGGLGWAYGLLAFVRYNQGRLDEAAAIAEHIAIEGRETGNRWAVGMMDVLLASVALWSGRTREAIARGQEAIELFQEIGDRWGEAMSTGSVVRGQAELGHDDEYRASLARFYEIAPQLPDETMSSFPAIVEAAVELQRGNAAAAWNLLGARVERIEETDLGAADEAAAIGLARMQLGDVDAAVAAMQPLFDIADADGPRMALGCRLALAHAMGGNLDAAAGILEDLRTRSGGTYSDRMIALWAESVVQARRGEGNARATVDAAHALAAATDARLSHAIAALARAKVLTALGDDDARDATEDADRQLRGLGLSADGWSHLFDCALAEVLI